MLRDNVLRDGAAWLTTEELSAYVPAAEMRELDSEAMRGLHDMARAKLRELETEWKDWVWSNGLEPVVIDFDDSGEDPGIHQIHEAAGRLILTFMSRMGHPGQSASDREEIVMTIMAGLMAGAADLGIVTGLSDNDMAKGFRMICEKMREDSKWEN